MFCPTSGIESFSPLPLTASRKLSKAFVLVVTLGAYTLQKQNQKAHPVQGIVMNGSLFSSLELS